MGVYGELSKMGLPDLRVVFHMSVGHWREREARAWLSEERRHQLLELAAALLREPLRFALSEPEPDGYRALVTIDVHSELNSGWWALQHTAAAWTGGMEKRDSRKNFHVSVDRLLWAGYGDPPPVLQSLD